MSAIQIICAFLFAQTSFAGTFETPIQEGDRLLIKGLQAQVVFTGQPGPTLKISGVDDSKAEGTYIVQRKDHIIEVRMIEFGGKRSWMNILPKASSQLRKIEISGASIPAEVQIHGGGVTATNWSRDLKMSLTQGKIVSQGGKGAYQAYVQKGDVSIQNHKGRVSVDGYDGNCALRQIEGDVHVSWFAGQLGMEKIDGGVNIVTQQAKAKLNQGTGSVQFENGKGTMVLQAFKGRLEGKNGEGVVSILMPLDSEVDVQSKSGKITVQTPPSAGARVHLFTADGDIYVPSELRVSKVGSERIVRGKMRGNAQRASVHVRSQEGTIVLK